MKDNTRHLTVIPICPLCYNNTKIGEWNSSWYTSWQIGKQWHTSNRQNTIIRKNVH